MTPDQIRGAITYANGIDPRVQMTAPNAEMWGRTIGHREAIEVKVAIQVYYERPAPPNRERPPIDAATVRKIIQEESTRADALESALAITGPTVRDPMTYRSRNPEMWKRLYEQGRDDHRADLRHRGITPHAESCPDCIADEARRKRREAVPTGAASVIKEQK